MPENEKDHHDDRFEYSDEDVARITKTVNHTHEKIKGIANAWVQAWMGDEDSADLDEIMPKINLAGMMATAGLMLAICTCIDSSLVKPLTDILNTVVAARIKADYKPTKGTS